MKTDKHPRYHPVVQAIYRNLKSCDFPFLGWEIDILVASFEDGVCQPINDEPVFCIALHFNFDQTSEEYDEHMQIVSIASSERGGGTFLVDLVMKDFPSKYQVCVFDTTEKPCKNFWPKMAKKYRNIKVY